MKASIPYSKFQKMTNEIKDLEKTNPRFKRVFSEFEEIVYEIWEIETGNRAAVPDDFIFALKLQKKCLEEEIDEWLGIKHEEDT